MVSKQKILIVDDDNNIAELISLYLVKECFDTKIVNDGESALEAVDSFAPNLILLDLMLPGIDGFAHRPGRRCGTRGAGRWQVPPPAGGPGR